MSNDAPSPPPELPEDAVEAFENARPEKLRRLARYAEDLATYRQARNDSGATATPDGRDGTSDDGPGGDDSDGVHADCSGNSSDVVNDAPTDVQDGTPTDVPEDVPSKATITIKESNDNRYYYWQWRVGDRVKSKYEGPVSSEEP